MKRHVFAVTTLTFIFSLILALSGSQRIHRGAPEAAAKSLQRPSFQAYFGALHGHTSYSDGSGTPEDAFKMARDQGRLDFFAVTEHNHAKAEFGIPNDDERKDGVLIATDESLYNGAGPNSLISAARRLTQDDRFVALYGQEFSTISSGNHVNVFEVGRVIGVADGEFARLYDEWLPQHPDSLNGNPLVQLNHPDYRADLEHPGTKPSERFNDYGLDDYEENFDRLIRHASPFVSLIEIVSGPATKKESGLSVTSRMRHEKDYWFYLNAGFRVAPTANQDNHFHTWGTSTRARTAVLAERLTKREVLEALKARRVYATEDENLQVRFWINDHEMGKVVALNQPTDLRIEVEVADPNEPQANYVVELYRDEVGGDLIEEPIEIAELEGDGKVQFSGQRYQSGRVFYFIKVSQTGAGAENFAWTAPVWLGPAGEAAATGPTAPAQPGFVHSRNSQVYHFANCGDARRIKPENLIRSLEAPEDKRLHTGCPRN